MEQLTNNQTPQVDGKAIREARKNNRLFILFLIIDLIIIGLIAYEIVALVYLNPQAQKAAEEAANAANQIRFLI